MPRVEVPETGRQLPFFGAETTEPSPTDLAGLLAGPGRLGRMGGTARVSVEVDAAWRVHVLVAELVARGLVAHWRPVEPPAANPPTPEPPGDERFAPSEQDPEEEVAETDKLSTGDAATAVQAAEAASGEAEVEEAELRPRFEVLTAYSSRLIGLARAWPEVSEQLFLSGPRLRLWVAAAGAPVPGGYALGLDPGQDVAAIDAALVRAGLAGRLSDDGTHLRIMGKRRVRRLAELVGERPEAAPEEMWPGGAPA
nr:hypothetical protein [Actinoplanes ferrugineus]